MECTASRRLFNEVIVPNYSPSPIIPVRGAGSHLWDQEDKEYIDFAGGIAVNALGHCHPELVQALHKQSQKLWHLSNAWTNEPALRLAEQLTKATFAQQAYFSNSGAEANEAALKLARKYAKDHFDPEKTEIIAFDNSFHGRTLLTVSTGGQPKYCKGFEPLPGDITHLPYNDLASVEYHISNKTCAVIVEPIQGEGGVIPAEPLFLEGLRTLCTQHNALLIFDEIQTGMGRTGNLFAYQNYEVIPDILTSAKALGCGIPIGAMLTTKAIAESFTIGSHGSTYGGNPLVCAVASKAFELINDPAVLSGVKQRQRMFQSKLELFNQKIGLFSHIRTEGLLIGCELQTKWHGKALALKQLAEQEGVMVLTAGPNILRLAPSLIIPPKDISQGLEHLTTAMLALKMDF